MTLDDLQIDRMNADELRDVAGTALSALAAGTITTAQANAITRAVGRRLAGVEAAMKARKLASRVVASAEPQPRKRQIGGPASGTFAGTFASVQGRTSDPK